MNYNLIEPHIAHNYAITVNLPLSLLKKIDGNRGNDINRSKYVKKLLEKALLEDKTNE
jgi:metal-responsive CopG/Arc/MetJ family transcriptional regulator